MSTNIFSNFNNIVKKSDNKNGNQTVEYGTAGFRSKAEDLDYVMFRVGILSVLRSKSKNGQTIGVMVTASHNPDCDNGVKLIDPFGEMLDQTWEKFATCLVNVSDEELKSTVEKIIKDEKIDVSVTASIFIGQDTRSSSPRLTEASLKGIKALNGTYINYGIVTTPILHYLVSEKNINVSGQPNEKDYFLKLSNAFKKLNSGNSKNSSRYSPALILDGSNGVGAIKAKELVPYLCGTLKIRIFNDGNGVLNHKCGADFVKVNQKPPEGIPLESNVRCVALDGDADRLIYFYVDENQVFHMLDGDRIATLIAGYLMDLVRESGVNVNLGLVQTAYANGSSTYYITNGLKVPVACVSTGVKHLHHKALEFDIGVYFEANGHGTVVYRKSAEDVIKNTAKSNSISIEQKSAAEKLAAFIDLTNQTVGDAVADVLLVETVLRMRDWSLSDWKSAYVDLPNRLSKVTIKDRNIVKTRNAERECTSPEGLQGEINALVKKYARGRSFVRPSGTEDVVRVYAEASTQKEADKLAAEVALAVHRFAGGVGDPPSIPA